MLTDVTQSLQILHARASDYYSVNERTLFETSKERFEAVSVDPARVSCFTCPCVLPGYSSLRLLDWVSTSFGLSLNCFPLLRQSENHSVVLQIASQPWAHNSTMPRTGLFRVDGVGDSGPL